MPRCNKRLEESAVVEFNGLAKRGIAVGGKGASRSGQASL